MNKNYKFPFTLSSLDKCEHQPLSTNATAIMLDGHVVMSADCPIQLFGTFLGIAPESNDLGAFAATTPVPISSLEAAFLASFMHELIYRAPLGAPLENVYIEWLKGPLNDRYAFGCQVLASGLREINRELAEELGANYSLITGRMEFHEKLTKFSEATRRHPGGVF